MTEQEIFDKVVARLFDGKGRAADQHCNCLYLTPDGNKCAVGIFIPDGHPAQNHFGNVFSLISKYHIDENFPSVIKENSTLFSFLQRAHDHNNHWNDNQFIGIEFLEKIARDFNLKYEV